MLTDFAGGAVVVRGRVEEVEEGGGGGGRGGVWMMKKQVARRMRVVTQDGFCFVFFSVLCRCAKEPRFCSAPRIILFSFSFSLSRLL